MTKTFTAKKISEELSESKIFFNKSFRANRENTTSISRSLFLICVPTYRVFELVCRAKSTQERVQRILIEDASYVTAKVRRRKILHGFAETFQLNFKEPRKLSISRCYISLAVAWLSSDKIESIYRFQNRISSMSLKMSRKKILFKNFS